MPHGLYNTDKYSYFSSVNSPQLSLVGLKDSKASEGWHWQAQSCLMVSGPALLRKKLTCVSTRDGALLPAGKAGGKGSSDTGIGWAWLEERNM